MELDGKDIALAYVMRENLAGGCSIFSYASEAVGKSAEEIGGWFVSGGDDVQRAIGCAVLTAASTALDLKDSGGKGRPFDVELKAGDRVGMIGNIRPVAKQLKALGCEMIVFDKGKCANGNISENIYPMERQAELLPTCDVVFLSGTTTVNGTAAGLCGMCSVARDIVMVGASTPMIPEGFRGTGVSILAGSWWPHEHKDDIFRMISQAAGMQALSKFMIKKNVRIA